MLHKWHDIYSHAYIRCYYYIIQVHHVTWALGLRSHVAPCIRLENGLKWVKSLILDLMIESTLPQLLDGFANITILACLIQYHYYLFSLFSVRNSLSNSIIQSSTARFSFFKSSHLNQKCFSSCVSPIVHCLQILSSLFRPLHLSQFQFSVQLYLLLA